MFQPAIIMLRMAET